MPHPSMEAAIGRAAPFLLAGLVVSPLLLLVPAETGRIELSIAHLTVLVTAGLALTAALAPLSTAAWFVNRSWGSQRRNLAGLVVLVVIVTGVIALVTLASSAALRLQPSLQFLQLL
jgi:amino acid transporter